MAAAPAPDGRHDDLGQDELAGLELLIPDDARSLDADRAQLMAELQQARSGRPPVHRQDGVLSRLLGSRFAAVAVPGSVVVVGIVVSVLFVATMVFLSPQLSPTGLDPLPIATAASAPVGQIGGVLPDAVVQVGGLPVSARAVRPGVLVLVSSSCTNCSAILTNLYTQVRLHRLQLALVGPSSQQQQLNTLAVDDFQTATVAIDQDGTLVRAFPPTGVTVVLVHADGIIEGVVNDLQLGQPLSAALASLAAPGSTTSS